MSTVVRLDDDVVERARRRAGAGSSPSQVLRAGLDALDASPSVRASVPRELGRVPFTLLVRQESVDWLGEVARRCGWTRDVAGRHVFSEGRRVLDLRLRRQPVGRRAVTPLMGSPEPAVGLEPADLAADREDAPVPA